MAWFHREILLPKFYRGPHAITSIVMEAMPEIAQIRVGLLHLFLKHTSASLAITENADRNVLADLEAALDKLAPEDFPYRHSEEGPESRRDSREPPRSRPPHRAGARRSGARSTAGLRAG